MTDPATVVDDQVAAYRALDELGRIHPVAQRVHGAVAVCAAVGTSLSSKASDLIGMLIS